jgi:hypothetical protein
LATGACRCDRGLGDRGRWVLAGPGSGPPGTGPIRYSGTSRVTRRRSSSSSCRRMSRKSIGHPRCGCFASLPSGDDDRFIIRGRAAAVCLARRIVGVTLGTRASKRTVSSLRRRGVFRCHLTPILLRQGRGGPGSKRTPPTGEWFAVAGPLTADEEPRFRALTSEAVATTVATGRS